MGGLVTDARNIALTLQASLAADQIMERLRLAVKVDVVRIGLAHAIRHKVSLERTDWGRPGGTNYNVATVDTAEGTFRELITIFYDSPEVLAAPYHTMETLMNKGLLLLKQHLDDGTLVGLSDLARGDGGP
jgi:hypothetical protein